MKKISNKNKINRILHSPNFYLGFMPHLITIFLVLVNSIEAFYILLIFFIQMLIDFLLYILALIFTRENSLQKIFKRKSSKYKIISKGFITGLIFIGFFGFLTIMTSMGHSPVESLSVDIINDTTFLLVIISYLVIKLLILIKNIYKYKNGLQEYIDQGESLMINLASLIFYVTFFFPLFLLGMMFFDTQFIVVILLITIRGLLDAALSS